MAVKIKNLLSIELFKDATIVAGNNGIDNEIKRVNFSDCPLQDDVSESDLIEKGDLFINSLYLVKNDEEKMIEYFKFYIDCKACGTFVIDEYIKELPKKVMDLCNENNFPVIFIDGDIPYAEIIKTTMEMILADQLDTISEMRIEKILENNVSNKLIVKTAYEINKNFKNYYASLYIKTIDISSVKKQILLSNVKRISNIEPVQYKNGVLLIMNFDKIHNFDTDFNAIESIISSYIDNHHIGVSNIFSKIEQFNNCIKQSILAYDISNIINKNTVLYKNLSVYKLLYPLKNTEILQDFYNDIIFPLIQDDSNHDKFELIKTIEAYLENDGDYKSTAIMLNQHENTIRYRIMKAKKILNLENNNFKFIEQVSIALKIKNMLHIN